MAESESHKKAKRKASGSNEVGISRGRRLDSASKKRATEVERSGTKSGLEAAARRLRDSRRNQNVLQVPQKDMNKASEAMRKVGASGTVKNMSGTRRRHVKKKNK